MESDFEKVDRITAPPGSPEYAIQFERQETQLHSDSGANRSLELHVAH
jgi:hypothetical protein